MNIQLKNISKVIHSQIILENVNLNFESGNIYGFVGTNGSGKTMLMRILSGMVSYSNGELLVNGFKVNRKKQLYYDMGIIIEKPEFFNELSALDNLIVLAKIKNVISKDEIIKSLNDVGLDPYSQKKVKDYSLGMKQRLGIAQAIMENPDVLILDEVTTALDEEGVKIVHDLLLKECNKGKIVIISSHHKEDIKELCHKIYLFKNQTVVEV